MAGPLTGMHIMNFTHASPGPHCTLPLADLGAEVVEIEPVNGGDAVRRMGPYRTPRRLSHQRRRHHYRCRICPRTWPTLCRVRGKEEMAHTTPVWRIIRRAGRTSLTGAPSPKTPP